MGRPWIGSRRDRAERYLFLTTAAFAVTVVAVRWYLERAGYPKIGGGGLHVAHMLWGGLLLVVAALLPLRFTGRRVLTLSALAAGVGVGLFIDEVGKFISESNDYFYAPAAPLIYGVLLCLALAWLRVRRGTGEGARDVLHAALEAVADGVDGRLTAGDRERALARLDALGEQEPGAAGGMAGPVRALLRSPEIAARLVPSAAPGRGGLRSTLERRLPLRLESAVILLGLLYLVLQALVATVILVTLSGAVDTFVIARPAGPVEIPTDLRWYLLLAAVIVIVGALCALALALCLLGRRGRGMAVARYGLLTSLVAGGLTGLYVAQFGATLSILLTLGLLLLVEDQRRRLRDAEAGGTAA